MSAAKIIYTYTDEAPALATYSLLPIIQAFTRAAGVVVETRDISLAGRILAAFPDRLPPDRRQSDDLAELGQLAKTPDANIIKLPNISASIPQLKGAIKELQRQGYTLPDYPEEPQNDEEKAIKAAYAKVLGSAVNPVMREGNSDRRVATSVKHTQETPALDGRVEQGLEVTCRAYERRRFLRQRTVGRGLGGRQAAHRAERHVWNATVLKDGVAVTEGDVIAASVMSRRALTEFFTKEIEDAKARGVLLSLHLKATMMKVSDPIMFGHAVRRTTRTSSTSTRRRSMSSASIPTTASATSTPRFRSCPRTSERRSRRTFRPSTRSDRRWRWSIRAKGSPICTCRAT